MQAIANVRDGRQYRASSLLFVDDALLIADDGEECFQRMVNEMGVVCGRKKLKLNVNKSKVMNLKSKYLNLENMGH